MDKTLVVLKLLLFITLAHTQEKLVLSDLPLNEKTLHQTLRLVSFSETQNHDSLEFFIDNYDNFFVNLKHESDLFEAQTEKSFIFRGNQYFILTAYPNKILAKFATHEFMGEVACLFELGKKQTVSVLLISCLGHQNGYAFEEPERVYTGHQEIWLWGSDKETQKKVLNNFVSWSQELVNFKQFHDYVFIPRKESELYQDQVSN
ncbi:MAG: hypothetical protein JNM93_01110 [Bacteriovoracaceae bacterium]|nr:hypothetical protein [Bacteriovoracaceae bacterium]